MRERENFEMRRGWTATELAAMRLRRAFVKTFIVDFDTTLYTTQVERDWAYIAKREYNYDVTLVSMGLAALTANAVLSYSIWRAKRMVWWPLLVSVPAFFYFRHFEVKKHSKKLFDMCNVGEEYYLGQKRNEVLRRCNEILDTEDF